jgi:hypothetical protein
VARPVNRRKRFPRGWGVSFTAVEVCVENAERLLIDATKTSPPTAAALAELSIEEAAKGWMLFLRLQAQGRTVRNLPRISKAVSRALEKAIEENLDDLAHLDDRILEAFRDHRVKLRFLRLLLRFVSAGLPLLSKKEDMVRISQDIHGPAFNLEAIDPSREIEAIEALLSSFRLEGLTDLDSIKKRGFYVNISERWDLVSPSIESFPTRLLLELAAFLIISLKGDLLLVTRRLSPRTKGNQTAGRHGPPAQGVVDAGESLIRDSKVDITAPTSLTQRSKSSKSGRLSP